MSTGYMDALELVCQLAARETPLVDAWRAVIDHLKKMVSEELREKLLRLELAADFQRIQSWLLQSLQSAPPSRKVRGFRFCLFHPERQARPSCDLALMGTPEFQLDTDVWAYETIYEVPSHPQSQVLDELYLLTSTGEFDDSPAVIHLGLWYGLLVVSELCRTHSTVIRGSAVSRGIGIGFNDGDLIILGVHKKSGFVPRGDQTKPRKPRRLRLLPGEFFKLEGGRDLVMCECLDRSLPENLFETGGLLEPLSLRAKVLPDWPDQTGTMGSLYPFHCHFFRTEVTDQIVAQFPQEVQFHELQIEDQDTAWRAMKVLQWVKCYDRKESQRVQKLTLHRESVAGHNIFYVEDYSRYGCVLVSRRCAQLMVDLQVIGASFVPVALS